MADAKPDVSFFRTLYQGEVDFDAERFLVEVEAQFESPEVRDEVRWRLGVLTEISTLGELADVSSGLKDQLTQIFSAGGDHATVLGKLKNLTEIPGKDGKAVDLRRFLKRNRRTYSESEYRNILGKKLDNTRVHLENLIAFYPDAEGELQKLVKALKMIHGRIADPKNRTAEIKEQEDKLRGTTTFQIYEDLKVRFLKDWLARFTSLSEAEIAGMTQDEIQRMILEHQRHQATQLLKTKIQLLDQDMTEHLGLHDTLEGEFKDSGFWKAANPNVRTGFRQWVLGAVQAFGMLKGQRYAFFQSEDDQDQYLLFGLGVASLPATPDEPIRMVPYVKPFTRKVGYLLEIRKRELSNQEEYHHELLHYVMPFLFAFDQMKDFKISKELLQYFNSRY
jgi:hypothetical protein